MAAVPTRGDDAPRVVVLDDDPTGTQTVSAVDILLRPTRGRLEAFFRSNARALYVLTNTRALERAAAVEHLGRIRDEVDRAAHRMNCRWTPVLRGDSTLRGHVFAETDLFARDGAAILFVPAFPEGGRVTLAGAQHVTIDGDLHNVADTEFARDPTFAYKSRDLVRWVAETGGGRDATLVPLSELREKGASAVASSLAHARPRTVVIPEATTMEDLQAVAAGYHAALSAGAHVVVRTASSLAAILAGLTPHNIVRVPIAAGGRVLIACGSFTAASAMQVAALTALRVPRVEIGLDRIPRHVASEVRACLAHDGFAIVTTPPLRVDDGSLASGATMMERLADVVRRVRSDVDAVIAKGGITSARLAMALGADVARVEGQLAPGVAVWTLNLRNSGRLPYVVVPGNVGGPTTLVDALAAMRPGATGQASA